DTITRRSSRLTASWRANASPLNWPLSTSSFGAAPARAASSSAAATATTALAQNAPRTFAPSDQTVGRGDIPPANGRAQRRSSSARSGEPRRSDLRIGPCVVSIQLEVPMLATEKLHAAGQSLWLDNLTRKMLESGQLAR